MSRAARWRAEAFWLLPFLILAAAALVLARPWPVFVPKGPLRTITDGGGKRVPVPDPVPGVVTRNVVDAIDFLEKTHGIDTVRKIDHTEHRLVKPKDLMARIYPRLAEDDSLWDVPGDIESVLAHDVGAVYLGGDDRFGLMSVNPYPTSFDDKDAAIFTMTRVWNELIDRGGQTAGFIARYRRLVDGVVAELEPGTLKHVPRVVHLISDPEDWTVLWLFAGFDPRLGLYDGTDGWQVLGWESDAERILAMNPDIFIGSSLADLARDPRWRGLDAVRARRVYGGIGVSGFTFSIDGAPLVMRWVAEVAYPDRMAPRMRELLRSHFLDSYGYRLDEDELDEILNMASNRLTLGYERFLRTASPSGTRP